MLVVPASTALLVLAGCGGTQDAASEDRAALAAEQVFAEEPVVTSDASGTTVVLRVTTEFDMACAVVFGRDESLGDGTYGRAAAGSPRRPSRSACCLRQPYRVRPRGL